MRDMMQTPQGGLTESAVLPNFDDPIHLGAKATMRVGQRFGFQIGHRGRLQIHQKTARIFERFFDAHKECYRAFAIHDAVIIGQGKIHHRADHNFTIDGHGAILDFVHAKNARLWRVQDR